MISPNTKQVDNKRWAIDLSALKQLIMWNNRDDCDEEDDGSKVDLSSLNGHVCNAVRLLNEDDDILPVDGYVEYRYL